MDRVPGLGRISVLCLVLGACASGVASSSGASSAESPGTGADDAAARTYCTDQGGELVERHAVYDTNADAANQLQLAGTQTFCEFESGTGNDTTRIAVDLVTLSSDAPTLAGLAYLSKVTPKFPETPSANPAAYNCDAGLNGAEAYGSAQGSSGGWVNEGEPVFTVMSMCMFADGSAIDEWGITYYAQGTIRGADLATKMRYQPQGQLPDVFPATRR